MFPPPSTSAAIQSRTAETATNTLPDLMVHSVRQKTKHEQVFPAVRSKSESTNHLGASVATTSKTASKPIKPFVVQETEETKLAYIYIPEDFIATFNAYAALSTRVPADHNPHCKGLEKMVDKSGVTPIDCDALIRSHAKSLYVVQPGEQHTVYYSEINRETPREVHVSEMREISEIAEQEVRRKEFTTSSAVTKIEKCIKKIRMSAGQDTEFPVITDYKKETEITKWNPKNAREWLSKYADTQLAKIGDNIDNVIQRQQTLNKTITAQENEIKRLENRRSKYSFNTGRREDEHQLAKYSRKIDEAEKELSSSRNRLEHLKSEYRTLSNYKHYQQLLNKALKLTEGNTEKKISLYIENKAELKDDKAELKDDKAELKDDKAELKGTAADLTQQTKTTTAKSSSHQHDKLKDLRMRVEATSREKVTSQEEKAKLSEEGAKLEEELDASLQNSATRHQPPVMMLETLKCFTLKTQKPLVKINMVKSPMSKHFITANPKEGTFQESVIYDNRLYVAKIKVEEFAPPATTNFPEPIETANTEDQMVLLESLPNVPPDGFGETSKNFPNCVIANLFKFLPDEKISDLKYEMEYEDDPHQEILRYYREKVTIKNKGEITFTLTTEPQA
ncbi:hypothetical protein MCT08_14615 [Vibrio aestuarianus]|uniref:coiled-coil domain-containing protein n=1 Tax=Vibrio aestuarianus TaxID=28171 RepID=UPI00237C5D56|nr:hypothetical protein [Vibrio aestuarianus]MDE1250809.1 hypothetical protein [Vibrio aestuarianus]